MEDAVSAKTLKHERLLQVLRYNPLTGIFTWRVDYPNCKVGDKAGAIGGGYWKVKVDGFYLLSHRLAWFYMTGKWPPSNLDHRNGVKSDNRWSNLRSGENGINSQNLRKAMRHNRSGFLGVHKHYGKWAAKIYANGHDRWLGVFSTAKAAHVAYLKAKRKLHPGCTI